MKFDPRLEELNRREAEDSIPLVIAVGIMLCIGVAGNAISFAFYGFITDKKTVTNFLIAVLAFNDMMTNLIYFDEMYVHVEQFKITSVAGCKIVYVLNNWVMVNSVNLMLVIAIERHRKICHPFSWQISMARAKVIVIVVTLGTLVFCCREAIFADIEPEHILMNDNTTVTGYVCVHSHDDNLQSIIKGSKVLTVVVYISLFVGIIACYSLIICKIYKTKTEFTTLGKKDTENIETISSGIKQEALTVPSIQDTESRSTYLQESSNTRQDNLEENTIIEKDKTCSVVDETTTVNRELGLQKVSNQVENDSHIKVLQVNEQEGSQPSEIKSSNSDNTIYKQELNKDIKESARKYPQDKLTSVERKLTVMVIVIAITSILSFVPYFLVILLIPSHYSTEDNLSNMKKKAIRESYKLNGVINPFIMGIFCTNFRQFIANLLCKCFRKKNN